MKCTRCQSTLQKGGLATRTGRGTYCPGCKGTFCYACFTVGFHTVGCVGLYRLKEAQMHKGAKGAKGETP